LSFCSLSIAEKQLTELETAISAGNYSALQNILLRQAISLHKVGFEFMAKSEESGKLRYKQACMDTGIRAFAQSLKVMRAIKEMKG
jgi:hypothetical protein